MTQAQFRFSESCLWASTKFYKKKPKGRAVKLTTLVVYNFVSMWFTKSNSIPHPEIEKPTSGLAQKIGQLVGLKQFECPVRQSLLGLWPECNVTSDRRQLHFKFFCVRCMHYTRDVGGASGDKKGHGARAVGLLGPSTTRRRGPFLSVGFPTVIILNWWISNC